LSCSYCCISWRTRACHIAVRPFKKQPLIVCVCRGPATRGTDNAYRGGCTVDTTTGGRAYVTRTTLRPRRPHGRRSRRRDRLLRGAGPAGRGQDVRRGRVLGHGLRHSRLPHRDRHAEAARRWHPPGALELRATRLRAGLHRPPWLTSWDCATWPSRSTTCRRLSIGQLPRATDWSVASASTRALGGWPTSGAWKGSSSRWPSASAEPRNAAPAAECAVVQLWAMNFPISVFGRGEVGFGLDGSASRRRRVLACRRGLVAFARGWGGGPGVWLRAVLGGDRGGDQAWRDGLGRLDVVVGAQSCGRGHPRLEVLDDLLVEGVHSVEE